MRWKLAALVATFAQITGCRDDITAAAVKNVEKPSAVLRAPGGRRSCRPSEAFAGTFSALASVG